MSYYSNGQSGLTILANSAAGQGTAQSLLYGRRKNRHGGRRAVTTRKNRKASRKNRKASRKNRKASRKNRKGSRKNRKGSRKASRRNRH